MYLTQSYLTVWMLLLVVCRRMPEAAKLVPPSSRRVCHHGRHLTLVLLLSGWKKWGILHRRVSLFRRIFLCACVEEDRKRRRGTQFLSSGNMASRWGRRHWQDQDDVWQSHTHTLRGGGQIITTHNMRVCLHIQRADSPRQREIRSEPPQFTGGEPNRPALRAAQPAKPLHQRPVFF